MTKETQAWIKKLSELAYNCYGSNDGDLHVSNSEYYINFNSGNGAVDIEGTFTIEQLEALLSHMKQYSNG